MNKRRVIGELTTLMANALRHRIGSIVNSNEIYAQKYEKDAEILLKEAMKVSLQVNWNQYDKNKIKEDLKKKLQLELEKADFLNEKKFEILDKEIDKVLRDLDLDL
ncbi:MAG: hypothetical protein AABX48_02625 [Nanoarchaeota archaeon]